MWEAANMAYDTLQNLEYQHGFADLHYLFCPGWMAWLFFFLLFLLLNPKYMLMVEITLISEL